MTSKFIITSAFIALALVEMQSAQAQTAQQLACQLSGSCATVPDDSPNSGVNTEEPTDSPGASAKPQARVSATRGFSIARKIGNNPSPNVIAAPGTRPKPVAPLTASKAKCPSLAGKGTKSAAIFKPSESGRADLRVSFISGSADMTAPGEREAMNFLEALQLPVLNGMRFTIAGHTDAVGSREHNLDLSRRRAQAVVDYLVANGADRSRFDVQGFGFDRPVPGLAAKSPENRRVEVIRIR